MSKPSVKRNILYQMFYELLALALPLVTTPYVSRVLGAEKIGIYSYTYSIAYYFGLVAMLGVKNHGNREIAKNRDSKESIERTFSSVYTVQAICSVFVIIAFVMSFGAISKEYRIFYIIQTLYVLSCALDINWFFWGLERFKVTVTGNTIVKLVNFVGIFLLVKTSDDLWKYCLIISSCCILTQFIMWFHFLKDYRYKRIGKEDCIPHLKPMLLLFIPVIAVSLFNVMDKIMVGSMSTKTQLGYYENSEKIINCVKTVITSFGTVMMPRMAKLVADKDEKQRKRYMSVSSEGIFFIAFALCFGLAGVSTTFAPIFFGNEFFACGILMIGLAFSLPFSAFASFIRTQYLIPNNMDKIYITAVITGAILNVVINASLIPSLNAMGAVIGTIVAEGAVCIVQCVMIKNSFQITYYLKKALPYCLIGLIMLITLFLINKYADATILGLLIRICCGASVYIILTVIYWAVAKNEIWFMILKKLKKI